MPKDIAISVDSPLLTADMLPGLNSLRYLTAGICKFNTLDELKSIIKTLLVDTFAEEVICASDDVYYSIEDIITKKYNADDFDYKTSMLQLIQFYHPFKQ